MTPDVKGRAMRALVVFLWSGSIAMTGGQNLDQQPPDSTAVEEAPVQYRGAGEAQQDDPSSRLEWQRRAWGVATPAFRSRALVNGKDHSDNKNARGPKWVNIGPTASDYEQNGSFTGPNTGLYKSHDGGSTWERLSRGLPNVERGERQIIFAVAPTNPKRLYALIGGRSTAGVYRSEDGGETWAQVSGDRRMGVDLRVHFKNKGVQQLLVAIIEYLPSPVDVPPIDGTLPDGKTEVVRRTSDSG